LTECRGRANSAGDPQSQKIMEDQMEQFFFGEGAKLPEGYVPQRAKD
jgi:Fe-S cluster biosynthesis and repair protein YggX